MPVIQDYSLYLCMLKAVFLLLVVLIVAVAPALLMKRLEVPGDMERKKQYKSAPETKLKTVRKRIIHSNPDVDRLFAECRNTLKEIGVPISESISPQVDIRHGKSYLGKCCFDARVYYKSDYDFVIIVSDHYLKNGKKELENTLYHELIHTVPGGKNHTGPWKKWAKFVSEKTGHKIQRLFYSDDDKLKKAILNR